MVNKTLPPRTTVLALLATISLALFTAPQAQAQAKKKAPAKPAAAQARPVTQQTLLEDSEAAFAERRYEDADKLYATLIEKYTPMMLSEQVAALTVRRAACQLNRGKWAEAEPFLRDFLDLQKFPNGAGDILLPGNNFRGAAMLSLSECLAKQGKHDEAIRGLRMFSLGVATDQFSDRMKAVMYMADLTEQKAAKGTPAEQQAATRAAMEMVKPITQNNLTIPEVREAGYKLVGLYTKLGMAAEANQLRSELEAKLTNPADLVRSNFLKLELGDRYFGEAEALQGSTAPSDVVKRQGLYKSAIAAYQGVHRRKYIGAFMDKAIEQAQARVEQIKSRPAAPANAANSNATGLQAGEDPLRKAEEDLEALKRNRESFQKNKSYDSVLAYRLGLCLVELQRPWEARIAFKEIMDKDPDFEIPGADGAMEKKGDVANYYYIVCLNEIRRFTEAQEECKKFLSKFTQSQLKGNVAVMLGDIFRDQEEYNLAVKNFRWALANVPDLKNEDREYIDAAIADSLFRNVDWADARTAIEKFLSTWPSSSQRESMTYMRALTYFYEGKYRETIAGFDEYRNTYGATGRFGADVAYRYALVILGVKPANDKEAKVNAEKVVQRCEMWLKEYGDSIDPSVINQIPEVINLKADAHNKIADIKSLSKEERARYASMAIDGYIETAKKAGDNKQVLDFALRELNKSLPARGDWKRLREVYEGLYQRDTKSPDALGHLYWVIKCTERMGKTPEEKLKSSEEAKLILSNAIVENINDVRQENVENLVLELAQKLAREVRRRDKMNRDKPGSAEPFDAPKELETLLKLKENQSTLIAQARGSFAKAEIAKALRQPEKAAAEYDLMARRFKPDELSPTILAILGDHLLATGKPDDAARFFSYLKETFRGSSFADFAFSGLSQIALDKNKPKDALAIAQDALESGIAFTRERDLRFLEARAQLDIGNLDEAAKLFDGIAKVKEWRGEVTAGCKYYLALIEERRGKYKEAHDAYQACYLQWKKYEKYSAKAVLAAARLLAEKLDRRPDAALTLNQQFFKNADARVQDRYKNTPEWAEAEKYLAGLN